MTLYASNETNASLQSQSGRAICRITGRSRITGRFIIVLRYAFVRQ
jgi:hypothetical protein